MLLATPSPAPSHCVPQCLWGPTWHQAPAWLRGRVTQPLGTANLSPPFCPVWSLTAFPCQQHTPLCSPGIYIRTLIEDSPAAADGRLSIGDRILAVNGTSLIGADYQR